MDRDKKKTYLEIAWLFAKLGTVAFGGPVAHIAMMESEIVNKRKWLSSEKFLDLIGATNLIPGPNSTEMTLHLGYHRGGIVGLFIAGICFIAPAVIITGLLAQFYGYASHLSVVEPWINGIKVGVLIIIFDALLRLGKKALKRKYLIVIAALAIVLNLTFLSEIAVILLAGLLGALFAQHIKKLFSAAPLIPLFALFLQLKFSSIFLVFLKVGSVLFGSGYVLVAYLDGELVEKLGWLTRSELLEAIAIGQFTPGPVLSTATFIGYQLNGWSGALAATLGIFLPSFLFVWILYPLVEKIRKNPHLSQALNFINAAVVGIMIAVLFILAKSFLIDYKSVVILLSCGLIYFYPIKRSAPWMVVISAVLGYLSTFLP